MRRIPLLLCLAFVLTGSSAAQTQVGFLAVGDYGVGGSRELALGQRMERFEARHPANMLVTLGDNDYLESPPLFRANWRKAFGWARRSGLRVGGVLGNHDYELGRGAYELKTLGMPGRYYTRKLGAVQLFFLDSNAITTRQTRWLEQQLSESTATWKVALFHHPPYTCGGHAGDSDVVRSWVPLFESYGVQLVLSGHDHNYQRFAVHNEVTYVVDGGGAAPLYRVRRCPNSYPRQVRGVSSKHGFLYFSATDDRLDVSAVVMRGLVIDHFTLTP